MASIDDFGQTNEPLSAPVFGGPSGWAAAVRDHLKSTRVQSGFIQTGGTNGEVAVVFPTPFLTPPVVTVSATTAVAVDAAQVGACIVDGSVTVNGFTARSYVASSGLSSAAWALTWIAVGPVAAVLPEGG